jgi:hypothetical protein
MDSFETQAAAATAELAAMKQAYETSPAVRADRARAELNRLEGDPYHANRVLTSHAAQTEVSKLKSQIAVAEADLAKAAIELPHEADLALAGVVPAGYMSSGQGSTAALRDQVAAVPDLRDRGLADASIREILTDAKFTGDQHKVAAALKERYLRDPAFVALYLQGAPEEMQQMTALNAILSSEIAD